MYEKYMKYSYYVIYKHSFCSTSLNFHFMCKIIKTISCKNFDRFKCVIQFFCFINISFLHLCISNSICFI